MKQKSKKVGRVISIPEVTHISSNGIWLLFDDAEYFLSYDEFPWFKNATISQIQNVERLGVTSLHWPELDVDLGKEVLEHPKNFPLVYK